MLFYARCELNLRFKFGGGGTPSEIVDTWTGQQHTYVAHCAPQLGSTCTLEGHKIILLFIVDSDIAYCNITIRHAQGCEVEGYKYLPKWWHLYEVTTTPFVSQLSGRA